VNKKFCYNNNYTKSSLHTIAPYVGKLRPEVVSTLIDMYSSESQTIFDPFSGSGTIPFEAWIKGRKTVGVDLNYYAFVLTNAKLFPYPSLDMALEHLDENHRLVKSSKTCFKANNVPEWVSHFFHPETLKEIIAWMNVLSIKKDCFLMSCLLGILHHQRPGFLSYPSSNGAPYLRNKKYPICKYPEMYEYRNVYERLYKKVIRSYKNMPALDFSIKRKTYHMDAPKFGNDMLKDSIIITSPPYMKSLTYARDNRLRLWFLGHPDWEQLDKRISLNKAAFSNLMTDCFGVWSAAQNKGNYCILIVGDIPFERVGRQNIPDLICAKAKGFNYEFVDLFDYPINMDRKFVKNDSRIKTEKICVFRRR